LIKQEYIEQLAVTSNILWKLIKENGHDPDLVFKQGGIDTELLNDPTSRISCVQLNDVWEVASRLIEDPCFAIDASKHWHPSYLHAMGYSWLAGKTLDESLERLERYAKMISDRLTISRHREYGEYTVSVHYTPDKLLHPLRRVSTLSVLAEMCRLNAGSHLHPVKVTFHCTYPGCLERFNNHFQTKITFGEALDSLTYASSDIYRELPSSNPYLAELNDQVILEYLEKLNVKDITCQVRASILKVLSSGKVSDDLVAVSLNMSTRSLQRKLQKENTTFRTLLDKTRNDLAITYIIESKTRLEEIAFITGFSEYSSFSRAFKRWTSLSPTQYREKHHQTE